MRRIGGPGRKHDKQGQSRPGKNRHNRAHDHKVAKERSMSKHEPGQNLPFQRFITATDCDALRRRWLGVLPNRNPPKTAMDRKMGKT
jgi:hypothetical protein